MEELLIQIDCEAVKDYWLNEFKSLEEDYGIKTEIIEIGEKHYVNANELFGIIEDCRTELELMKEKQEELERYYEER